MRSRTCLIVDLRLTIDDEREASDDPAGGCLTDQLDITLQFQHPYASPNGQHVVVHDQDTNRCRPFGLLRHAFSL
jgi:hypothetical protein